MDRLLSETENLQLREDAPPRTERPGGARGRRPTIVHPSHRLRSPERTYPVAPVRICRTAPEMTSGPLSPNGANELQPYRRNRPSIDRRRTRRSGEWPEARRLTRTNPSAHGLDAQSFPLVETLRELDGATASAIGGNHSLPTLGVTKYGGGGVNTVAPCASRIRQLGGNPRHQRSAEARTHSEESRELARELEEE